MTGRQKRAREQFEELVLDELAPTRHTVGKARVVGRMRSVKGAVEGYEDLIVAEVSKKVELEQERVQRFARDMREFKYLAQYHEKLFPNGPRLDPELTLHYLDRMSPTFEHSLGVSVRVPARSYGNALLPVLLALQEHGRRITAHDKINLVSAWSFGYMTFENGVAIYPEPAWIADQLRAAGVAISLRFVKAVLAGRLCEHCGEPIPDSRGKKARFCSEAHRKDAYRAKQKRVPQTA